MSWTLDTAHTKVGFSVRHLMISTVRGEFQDFEADIDIDPDNLADSEVNVTIDVASIDTNNDDRDGHLRSADFFNVEDYPTIHFHSSEFRPTADGVEIDGELTIHGQTNDVTLEGEQRGPSKNPINDSHTVGYSLSGEVDREAFGLTWNQALETGGVMVGKEVTINIDAEAVEQS